MPLQVCTVAYFDCLKASCFTASTASLPLAQTKRLIPESSLQRSIAADDAEYQNQLALNEQQQAMKREMEQ
uniref:AlNc14C198G8616 protein n=1 Tax=Albugo laibachii Nc14 TaxID=890382 RepID=F0WQE6_9STRA|nr:AlNc14C198G8616 [Albugo laibachii Nc14]|eukprot:CCA23554.1 AlNc14C198G8616 [Albugo laibachii Nc14]